MSRTIASCLFAVCLVSPLLAQERGLSEADARKVADTMSAKYESTFNAADAAGLSNLFSEDGTYLPASGPVLTGRQAIQDSAATRFQSGKAKLELAEKVLEAHPAGDAVWATGEWTSASTDGKEFRGHFAFVLVPDGRDWSIRMAISSLTPSK
jgi:uncharacterized protein (TIGR02246 family)